MKQTISVAEALGAGFRLIGREPLAFAAWCAAYFAFSAMSMLLNWNSTSAYYEALAAGNAAASVPAAVFGPAYWLSLLFSLVLILAVYAGIVRAVLHPDERRFFYLRLGMRELWVALSAVLATLLWSVAYIVCAMVIGLGIGSVAAAAGDGGELAVGIVVIVLAPVLLWAFVWASLRLSMATVMSFAENRLRVLASWRFTKGHALALFLVSLVLGIAALIVFVALSGIALGGLAAGATGQPNSGLAMLGQISQTSAAARLAFSAVVSVAYVSFLVMFVAPWAEMYRQLRPASMASTFD